VPKICPLLKVCRKEFRRLAYEIANQLLNQWT